MTHADKDSQASVEQTIEDLLNKRLATAYQLARASVGSPDEKRAIDFFYRVHLDNFGGLAESEIRPMLVREYKYGLMTGTLPEALGKPIAEGHIATLTKELSKADESHV